MFCQLSNQPTPSRFRCPQIEVFEKPAGINHQGRGQAFGILYRYPDRCRQSASVTKRRKLAETLVNAYRVIYKTQIMTCHR
jgi:hypothetical protein